jgi:hypothetical protein
MKGRVGQILLGVDRKRLDVCASRCRRDIQVVGKIWALDAHLARRSSSFRSSSKVLAQRALNVGLFGRRSTTSIRDYFIVSLKILPSIRASALASAATSTARLIASLLVMFS